MEIAQNTGLVKRKRKLMPDTILKVFTFGLLNIPNPSLKQIAAKCEDVQQHLEITKNGVYNRLNKISTFLLKMFNLSLQSALRSNVKVETTPVLTQFKDIKIYDSTRISLPNKLADIWPGLGGRNANASLKIQAGYSLSFKSIFHFELVKSPGTDVTYNDEIIAQAKEKELIITDLGYFNRDFFTSISNKGTYYLTRVRQNAIIGLQKDGNNKSKQKQILKLLKNKQVVDTQAFIGSEHSKKLQCRLIAIRLPEGIVNERRRKANKKAKSKGKQLSKYESELLAWNILITNIPVNMISAQVACDLYRARWQIELVFKACKSHLNIDKMGNCGEDQLKCLIYGRLIAAIMIFILYNHYYPKMQAKYGRGISILLFVKLVANKDLKIIQNLFVAIPCIRQLTFSFKRIAKHSLYDKRKRKTTLQRLMEHLIPKPNYQNSA